MAASTNESCVDSDISTQLNALSLNKNPKCESSLYILGGLPRNEGKRVDRLNIHSSNIQADSNWIPKRPMNASRSYFGVVAVNGLIYVIGGRGTGKDPIHETIECYNPGTDKWTTLPGVRPKYKRSEFGLTAIGEQIFLVGGHGDSSRAVECFDVKQNNISELSGLSRGRWALEVASCRDRIYACGGQWYNYKDPEAQRQSTVYFNDVESYDPVTREWKREDGMLRRRGYFGLAAHDHFLYAVGGMGGECNKRGIRRLDSMERFDTYTGQWTMIETCLNGGISNLGVAVINSNLLAIGGNRDKLDSDEQGENILNTIQIVDLNSLGSSAKKGKSQPQPVVVAPLLPSQRHSFSVVVLE